MKLMSYNILEGGGDRFDGCLQIIQQEAPDFLAIQEANGFEKHDSRKLRELSERTGLAYFHLALSGEHSYHVAVLSRFPFRIAEDIRPLTRAAVATVIDTPAGELAVMSAHLTPRGEESRLLEAGRLVEWLANYERRVLLGDFNALSRADHYADAGKLRFDVVQHLGEAGYMDAADESYTATFPAIQSDAAGAPNRRLDYFFVSEALKPVVAKYRVVRNSLADRASDHYPIVVELAL